MNREFYRLQFRMEAEQNETAEIMIYSEIASEQWWGDETTCGDFDKAVKNAVKNGAKKLNLRINCGGGEVYAAVAMRSMVINAGFEEIRIMIEGLCASAATLFATIPGARVVIAAGSEFMIHNPKTSAWGNAQEIEKTVDHLHVMEGQFREMYAAKTGKEIDQIKAWMDETKWFTARQAVEEGFCDELLEAEPVAACVTPRDMTAMTAMYGKIPEEIRIQEGRNENPVAGFSTVNKNKEETQNMEIKDITRDQLLAENPALAEEIRNSAIQAERERMEEIDALCVPGYEAMAEEAKKNGTTAIDFQKSIVKAMKEKGNIHMAQRVLETAPADNVAGGSASDTRKNEDEELKAFTDEIRGFVSGSNNNTMF